MSLEPPGCPVAPATDVALQTYLLGPVDFESALAAQRRLTYQVAGERGTGCLMLCEHEPLLTVGRQGSRAHIRFEPEELRALRWPIRWINRGGGCLLHLPGQLVAYPILPLDRLGLGLRAYLDRLQEVVALVLADFSVQAKPRPGHAGLWTGGRLIAGFGIAVRDWVSYHGCFVNIDPDLQPFRRVSCGGANEPPMTSLARERHGRVRPALVRQLFLEYFAARFGFARTALFFDLPGLNQRAPADAIAAHY